MTRVDSEPGARPERIHDELRGVRSAVDRPTVLELTGTVAAPSARGAVVDSDRGSLGGVRWSCGER